LLRSIVFFFLAANPAFAQQHGVTESGVKWRVIEDAGAVQTGRYVGFPQSNGPGVWLIDSQTGELKFCWPFSVSGAYGARCAKAEQ